MASLVENQSFNSFNTCLTPIVRKGMFFDDAFFNPFRTNFLYGIERSLSNIGHPRRRILSNWYDQSLSTSEDFNHLLRDYRNIWMSDHTEDSHAVSVTRNGNNHQITLDANGFDADNLSVKAVGQDELLIEGNHTEKTNSSMKSTKFMRKFKFPGMKLDQVTAGLSQDGIFTVQVPVQSLTTDVKIPITLGGDISIKKEANQQSLTSGVSSTKSEESSNTSQASSSTSEVTAATSQNIKSSNTESKKESLCDLRVPVSLKGSFLQDDFYYNFRSPLLNRISSILKSSGIHDKFNAEDTIATYRRLRSETPCEENQASSLVEDSDSYKITVDVNEFLEGELKIFLIDDQQLKIEGSASQNNKTIKFEKMFILKKVANAKDITATVSDEGLLTVIVPKQVNQNFIEVVQESNKEEKAKSITDANTEPINVISSTNSNTNQTESINTTQISGGADSSVKIEEVTDEKQEVCSENKCVAEAINNKTSEIASQNVASTEKEDAKENKLVVPNYRIIEIVKDFIEEENDTNKNFSTHSQNSNISTVSSAENEAHISNTVGNESTSGRNIVIVQETDDTTNKINSGKETKANEQLKNEANKSSTSSNANSSGCRIIEIVDEDSNKNSSALNAKDIESTIQQQQTSSKNISNSNTQMKSESKSSNVQNCVVSVDTSGQNNMGQNAVFSKSLIRQPRNIVFKNMDIRQDVDEFLNGVRQTLSQWGVTSSKDEWLSYRSFRRSNSCSKSQAKTIMHQDDHYKIHLDVYGYSAEDLKIKANERSIVIEGTKSADDFSQTFQFPTSIITDKIISYMPSQGILTIIVPKHQGKLISIHSS